MAICVKCGRDDPAVPPITPNPICLACVAKYRPEGLAGQFLQSFMLGALSLAEVLHDNPGLRREMRQGIKRLEKLNLKPLSRRLQPKPPKPPKPAAVRLGKKKKAKKK
jgi:hypothetical protein